MNWVDVISGARIRCGVRCETKREAIGLLCEVIARDLDLEADALRKAIGAREQLGATTIGNGVLLPHAVSELVERPIGALLLLGEPLGCSSPDDVPVDIVIGVLMPQDSKGMPLLARLVQPLRDEDTLRRLRDAGTPEDAMAALRSS